MVAASDGRLGAAKLLVASRARISYRNANGQTALELATMASETTLSKEVLETSAMQPLRSAPRTEKQNKL